MKNYTVPRTIEQAFGPYATFEPKPDPILYVISRYFWSLIL